VARLLLALCALAALAAACDAGDADSNARSPDATPTAVATPTPKTALPTPPASCPVSDQVQVREGLGLGMGRSPVWMVGALPSGPFEPAPPVDEQSTLKRIWVVDDGVQGEVRITGRRLDGDGEVTFPVYERDPQYYEQRRAGTYELKWERTELLLLPPYGLEQDHRTLLYYPSAGCWELTARTATDEVRIVHYLYEGPS
jgi:hypothetical protein